MILRPGNPPTLGRRESSYRNVVPAAQNDDVILLQLIGLLLADFFRAGFLHHLHDPGRATAHATASWLGHRRRHPSPRRQEEKNSAS